MVNMGEKIKHTYDCEGFSPYWCDGIDCNECKCFMPKRIKEEQTEINFD